MAGALFEPSFAAAHPAGLLRRPVTRTVVLSVAATSIAHMFEISLPDPTELCRSDDGALVAAIEDCARVEAAASARRLSAIAELTAGAPARTSGPTGRVTSGTARPRRWLRR